MNKDHQLPDDPWKLTTVRIIDRLLTQDAKVLGSQGEQIAKESLSYTIFDQTHTYHNAATLAELMKATGEQPKFLAAFKPHRLALHLLIAHVSTSLEHQGDDDLQKLVRDIYESTEFKNRLSSIYQTLTSDRDSLEINIKHLVHEIVSSPSAAISTESSSSMIRESILNAIQKVKISNIPEIGKYIKGFDHKTVVTILALDSLYNKKANEILSKEINNIVHEYATRNRINLVKPVKANEMLEYMVAGGQASGKGFSVAKIKAHIEEERQISWGQFVKINTDSYKPLILNPADVRSDLYSQLAQEEASLIHLAVQRRIELLANLGQSLHHIFIDQVFIGEDKINLAVKNDGKAYVTVVSTDVEVAVTRSFQRGVKSGRFESTQGILTCHRNMTAQTMITISKFIDKDVFLTILNNDVAMGEDPLLVMQINLRTKSAIIHDMDLLMRFAKKILINVDATSKDNLYLQGHVDINEFLKPLRDAGISITVPSASTNLTATSAALPVTSDDTSKKLSS